ncbi:MAG: ECF transporter S component, partial [Synergistaceae bacterium]|nr:ECF transporter S component [Synergistaceae bacterium]
MPDSPEKKDAGIRCGYAVFIVGATLLFALCNALTSFVPLLEVYQIRVQVAIPMLSGYLAGPGAGFLIGLLGNILGDALSGTGALRFAASFSVCNGIYGLMMGLFGRKNRRFDNPEDVGRLYVFMLFAIAAGTFYAAFVEALAFGANLATEFERLCVSIIVSNYIASAMLVPWFLYATGRVRKTIVQKYTLFLYYFSFALAVSSVGLVLYLLSFRFDFGNSHVAAHTFMYDVLIVPVIAVIVVGTLASSGMTRRIVKPLLELSREIRQISSGGFTDRIKVEFGEDLRDLSESFNEMTDRLADYSDEIRKIAGEKERVRTELQVASKIQR